MLTSMPSCRARLSLDGQRFILAGGSPSMLAFCHSLPEARFDRTSNTWSCLRTPAAAMRVLGQEGLVADPALLDTAAVLLQQVYRTPPEDSPGPTAERFPSWKHQRKAFAFAKDRHATLLAMDMGTGKSKVAVDLLNAWGAKTILILAPKSVLPVWRREFARHSTRPLSVLVLERGSIREKEKVASEAARAAAGLGQPLAIVVNYDAARCEPLAGWTLAQRWDVVILDESHRAKAHNSLTSKYCAKLGRRAARRLCLTGTPLGQGPLDIFGQFRFLDPGVYGTAFTHFRSHFAVCANPHIPQQVTGYKNEEELQARMAWLTYRCRAIDVLDLPAVHHIDRRFPLGKESSRVYREMENDLIAEIASGVVCTAANALVRMLRLSQVTSGFLAEDDTGLVVEFGQEKIGVLKEILEDVGPDEPVVVFCRFRHDLRLVETLTKSMLGNLRYAELSGERRDALDDQGCLAEGVQVAGVQIQSGGVGIDLTRARYAVYYNCDFSLTGYDQSIARLHRPGQRRVVHYYHLIAEIQGGKTIDDYIYRALDERREIVESVLSVLSQGERSDEGEDQD